MLENRVRGTEARLRSDSPEDDGEIPKEIPREIKVTRAKQRHPVNGSRKSKDEYPECKICAHTAPMTVLKSQVKLQNIEFQEGCACVQDRTKGAVWKAQTDDYPSEEVRAKKDQQD